MPCLLPTKRNVPRAFCIEYCMIPYDRAAATAYAARWALDRNPAYADFSQMGGDCTNFVSQCIHAGNMPMHYGGDPGWFYISLTRRSAAWSSAAYLYDFLTSGKVRTGPAAVETTLIGAEIGDVVQLSFDGTRFTHSLIIVDKTQQELYLAAHSSDVYCKPLSAYIYNRMRILHITGAY